MAIDAFSYGQRGRIRSLFVLALVLVLVSFSAAFYAQFVLLLEPCPLCIFQRVALLFCGLGALLGAVVQPSSWLGRFGALILSVSAWFGAGVAAWHVRLQLLPPEARPACGPGLDFLMETFSLMTVLEKVFSGSGECADEGWALFGVSMPMWSLAVFLFLAVLGGFLFFVRRKKHYFH